MGEIFPQEDIWIMVYIEFSWTFLKTSDFANRILQGMDYCVVKDDVLRYRLTYTLTKKNIEGFNEYW